MSLLDHFHPPLKERRHWESFHAYWAAAIGETLNRGLLPKDYFAEVQVHVGSRVGVDVATFEDRDREVMQDGEVHDGGGTATLVKPVWAPPAPALQMPAIFPDSLEVLIINSEAGPTLVGAIELVSPGNKDRPESRRAFAAKCASYLQQGVGVVIVDIVTDRAANLHNDLIDLLGTGPQYQLGRLGPLYATSYHPFRRPDADRIEIWASPLAVGQSLPVVPLPLDKRLILPLDLGGTYTEACRRSRLP